MRARDCRSLVLSVVYAGMAFGHLGWKERRAGRFARLSGLSIYIAASFRHMHGVRLLGRELRKLGCHIHDWTEMATPPEGLTPLERRIWMDTDRIGGEVYAFCRTACEQSDLLIYYGASGQDAGVEVGLACASDVPILGIRGPLEGPGLMLHGAVTAWVDSAETCIDAVAAICANLAGRERLLTACEIRAEIRKNLVDAIWQGG